MKGKRNNLNIEKNNVLPFTEAHSGFSLHEGSEHSGMFMKPLSELNRQVCQLVVLHYFAKDHIILNPNPTLTGNAYDFSKGI